jgi:TonB family protein
MSVLAFMACASTSTRSAGSTASNRSLLKPHLPDLADGRTLAATDTFTAPEVIDRTIPVYPIAAIKKKIAGVVILKALIDEMGKVADIEVIAASSPILADAALEATWKWRYKPATLNGQPIAVWNEIRHEFTRQ